MENQEYIYYFAIGSMMNPTSLSNREIDPKESFPGEILNYKIFFFGSMGMAEALPEEGSSFHGVVHKIDLNSMARLDKIESIYTRLPAQVKLYDGNIIQASVYTRQDTYKQSITTSKPPTERYIDIMVRGCIHYKVKQSYIDWLKSLEVQPRIKPQDFQKFEIPEGLPMMTEEELQRGDGKNGNPFYLAINGKVRQYLEGYNFSGMMKEQGGKHYEMFISKILYEPLYGIPQKIEDFRREHCAMIEDLNFRQNINSIEYKNYTKWVGLIDQKYID